MHDFKELEKLKRLTLPLKPKLVLFSLGGVVLITVCFSWLMIYSQTTQQKNQLRLRGKTIADLLAYNAKYGVSIGDNIILDKLIGGVKDDEDINYVLITDAHNKMLADYNDDKSDWDKIKSLVKPDSQAIFMLANSAGEQVFNINVPVVLERTVTVGGRSADEEEEDDFFMGGEEEDEEDAFMMGGEEASKEEDEEDFFMGAEDENEAETAVAALANLGAKKDSVVLTHIGTVHVGISLARMEAAVAKSTQRTILISLFIIVIGAVLAIYLGESIVNPVKNVVALLNDIAAGKGDLSQRISIKTHDETGDLAAGFNTFMDKFQEIKKISVVLTDLAEGEGDLTKRLHIDSKDEIGMLAKGFDQFTSKLHSIIQKVALNSNKISQFSHQIFDKAKQIRQESESIAGQASEVASAATKMSAGVTETSQNVDDVNDIAMESFKSANHGVRVVQEAINNMNQISSSVEQTERVVQKLNESSNRIGEIIDTITEIADDTNLLALNATIEAARVGEQARGFTVVADEIRRLAEKTTRATEEIGKMIANIQEETREAVVSMKKGTELVADGLSLTNKSGESLSVISSYSDRVQKNIKTVSVATRDQSATIQNITDSITSISSYANKTGKFYLNSRLPSE